MAQDAMFSQSFWQRVFVYPDSDCWFWEGSKNHKGYGQWSVGPKRARTTLRTHRMTYEKMRGAIPPGLVIDHLCRNRNCCNPWHMEPVTTGENTRRGNTGKDNRMKTVCHKGHPLSGDNLYKHSGRRHCRICRTQTMREIRARKKAAHAND